MPPSWEDVWSPLPLAFCLTLTTRPERRRAASQQLARVGLTPHVTFLEARPDEGDGKRGCFHAHQRAAGLALERGASHVLILEDDVEFLPHFTLHAGARIARFLASPPAEWELFFLGHFPSRVELTPQHDVLKVRSMDAHAYLLSAAGARRLCELEYRGEQVDVHFHYRSTEAYALYPMVAVQRASFSDTEGVERPSDWNEDKLAREANLYRGCVGRKIEERVMSSLLM